MNIEKLLEYQNADREYDNLIKERNSKPDTAKYLQAKKLRDLATSSLNKLNNDNTQTHQQLERLTALQKEIEEEVDAILESVNQLNADKDVDEEEIDYLAQRLDTITSEIDKISKDINTILDRVVALRKDCDKNMANRSGSIKLMKDLSDSVKKTLEEYAPKEKELTEKKDAIRAQLAPEDVEEYERIRGIKKGAPPVIVPLRNERYCGGCLRELSQSLVQKLQDSGYVTCQECSRIVYNKKD